MSVFTKRVTTDLIAKYVARFGISEQTSFQQLGEAQGVVVAPLEVPGETYRVNIDPIVEIGQLEFSVPNLLHASLDDTPADRVHGLLLTLGALNYRMPLGHLSYDPRDGEVALRYGLPIADDELAYENFERVLVVFQNILAKHVPGLRAIVAGEKTAREVFG